MAHKLQHFLMFADTCIEAVKKSVIIKIKVFLSFGITKEKKTYLNWCDTTFPNSSGSTEMWIRKWIPPLLQWDYGFRLEGNSNLLWFSHILKITGGFNWGTRRSTIRVTFPHAWAWQYQVIRIIFYYYTNNI